MQLNCVVKLLVLIVFAIIDFQNKSIIIIFQNNCNQTLNNKIPILYSKISDKSFI